MKKLVPVLLSLIGIADSAYLAYEHFSNRIVPCSIGAFADCGKVLSSEYAVIFGIPLAVIGLIHYILLFTLAYLVLHRKAIIYKYLLFLQSSIGLIASLYFMYLQLGVIGAICIYCTVSAINSLLLFIIVRALYKNEYRRWLLFIFARFYQVIIKNIFFLFEPEGIHNVMTRSGELMGRYPFVRTIYKSIFTHHDGMLQQKYSKIRFSSPIGLSAGFDYEARLTQILPSLGFGFQTIGTITNQAYEGNPTPRLGRLPKSKSLMVNKGFKNDGAKNVIKKLKRLKFAIPVGVSIGRTNSAKIKTVDEAITDVLQAFDMFEDSSLKHSYYELNISCPNLQGNVSFFEPVALRKLLEAVDDICLLRPLFIKMPIEVSDKQILAMLNVITDFKVAGIIIGNLQKNRKDPALNREEVKQWSFGNFSGKATEQRSNELIALTYKNYGKKLLIVGCGGVFSAEDAYKKIKMGASLIQLITGMIFMGPQLIAQINEELPELLEKDGFTHISQAIGSGNK